MVKRRRLELPRHNCHYPLKVARLPIPPPLQHLDAILNISAQDRTRTCTLWNTRTWNVRVYQFRHLGSKIHTLLTRYVKEWSGKRDSDPRPQPWQGCALPTELFPLVTTSRSEEEETRTPTTQLSLPPQSSASTNSATSPLPWNSIPNTEWHVVQNVRAENGTRTRDPNLGKVVLYQLSYFRLFPNFHRSVPLNASAKVLHFFEPTKFFSVFFIKNAHFSSF